MLVIDSADEDFFIPHGDMGIIDDPESFARLGIASEQNPEWNPMMRLHGRIRTLPYVTVGILRGRAGGGGAELFTALDLRYGSLEGAVLLQLEAPTGIIPGSGATAFLPRMIGRSRTLEVILTAASVDARTAEQWGWLTRALPDAELDAYVDEVVSRIASLPDGVAAATLAAVDAAEESVHHGLDVENRELGALFTDQCARLTRAALAAGAQTRQGERDIDAVIERLRGRDQRKMSGNSSESGVPGTAA